MALPNPSQGQMPPQEGTYDASGRYIPVSYNPATFRESITTGLRAGVMAKTANIASASPILRMLGGGMLADTLSVKRREMLYAQGRDPETGRKLTRQELEEREMRKASYGTMADIKENVVLIAEMLAGTSNSILKNLGGGTEGKPKTLAPGETGRQNVYQRQTEETGGFGLADEERAEEREREDDQDQLESEARQQGFFTKLFGKFRLGDGGGNGEPGWVSKLISGIGSLFSTVASNLLGGLLSKIGLGGLVGGAGRAAAGAAGGLGRGAAQQTTVGTAARGTAQAPQQTGVMGRVGRGLGRAVGTGKNLVVGAAKTAGGWMSSAWGAIKSVGSRAIGAVSNLNPIKAIKEYIKPIASKFLPKLLAIPAIGTALTAILSAVEIQGIKKDPMLSKEEKKKQIGTVLGSSIGSVIGGVGGGALGTLLGPLGTIGGAIGGSLLGSYVGEAISEALGPEKIFDIAESIPLIGDAISVDEGVEAKPIGMGTEEGLTTAEERAFAAMDEQQGSYSKKYFVGPEDDRIEVDSTFTKAMDPNRQAEVDQIRSLRESMASGRGYQGDIGRNMVPPSRKDGTDLILGSEENAGLKATPPTAAISAPQTNVVNTNNSVGIAPPPNAVRPSGADYAPRYQGGGLRYAL